MSKENRNTNDISMIIASTIGLALIFSFIYILSDLYSGSALESALTLRNGIGWTHMFLILSISAIISFILSLVIFWLISLQKYDEDKTNRIFSTSFKFALTLVLVIALLLFFNKTQFSIIASGLSIWALLSTLFKKNS